MPLNVVLIDDESELCDIFGELFGSDQVVVKAFSVPREGITYIKRYPPDLIILDNRLPDTTGDQIAQDLKTHVPIALITGDLAVKPMYKFRRIFQKPFKIEEIKDFLLEELASKNKI